MFSFIDNIPYTPVTLRVSRNIILSCGPEFQSPGKDSIISFPSGFCNCHVSCNRFDNFEKIKYNNSATGLDSRAGSAERPSVRKVRAPQGKDNG